MPAAAKPPLERYLQLLRRWSERVDLVSPADDATWIERHILDGLGALAAVPAGSLRVVDVGSGAGLPGLIWAAARPELQLTLVEPRARRVAFLRTAIREMGLEGVEVVPDRAQSLFPARFDVAVSRATFPYAAWLPVGSSLVRSGGRVLALLSEKKPEGLGEVEASSGLVLEAEAQYRLPRSGALRRVMVLLRLAAEGETIGLD